MVKGLFVFGLVLGIGFPHAAGGALAPFPSTLNLDRVVQAIEAPESSIRSVEALLAWISRHHPDHLTRYTLMRRSRSSQQASPQSPRAIVFGGDAKFIFTFNGGTPGQTGHDRVEMIQFREAGRGLSSGGRFEFREIQFSPTGSRPTISEPNPARCTECHQSTLHPIWAAYETWEGAYGKHDDALIDFEGNPRAFTGGQSAELMAEHKRDREDYLRFSAGRASHPRYRWLRPPEGSPVSPYSPNHRGEYRFRPNLFLTFMLAQHQAKHVVALMAGTASFTLYRANELLFALADCPEGEDGERKAVRLLRAHGIELGDWSLEFYPARWRYFEGAIYLQGLVAQELDARARAAGVALPPQPDLSYRRAEYFTPRVNERGEMEPPGANPWIPYCAAIQQQMQVDSIAERHPFLLPIPVVSY